MTRHHSGPIPHATGHGAADESTLTPASHYSSLDEYTADVKRARDAYAADMAVQRGFCATCKRRRKDEQCRECWTCRHERRARKRNT